MDAKERTAAIKKAYAQFGWTPKWFEFIANQIAEAQEEAVEVDRKWWDESDIVKNLIRDTRAEGIRQGRESMREEAIKIANSMNPKGTRFESEIADRIRALK